MAPKTTHPVASLKRADNAPAEWFVSADPVDYKHAVATMEARAAAIAEGRARELVWLLEHPPLYTAGVSAKPEDLLQPDRLPVYATGRGGQYTYHGPGQRVAYVMLDLTARGRDVRAFVQALENWIIEALAMLGVRGRVHAGRVGVWVDRPDAQDSADEAKIAAIGVRLRRWVSFHGVSLNVDPDLSHFAGIVPCGISDRGVTSLADLRVAADMAAADRSLRAAFTEIFGGAVDVDAPISP